ncbi:hypothetical protein Hanom_Chr04g00354091 [Helianthus anomalus]
MLWFVRSKKIFLHEVKDDDVMERFQAIKKKKRTHLLEWIDGRRYGCIV